MAQDTRNSLWAHTAAPDISASALQGDVQSDVVIVGGGFTGCAAALALALRGVKAHVLEAHAIGWGASGTTGGQVIPGLKYDPDEIDAMFERWRLRPSRCFSSTRGPATSASSATSSSER